MREFFNEHIHLITDAVDRFPWKDKRSYANMLAQAYYYVAHSTRLLAVSAGRFSLEDELLHRRFITHMVEEKSHHLLALHDLKSLGFELSQYPELPATRAFYEPQYFKCEHKDPISLFGYILALEGMAASRCKKMYEDVSQAFGSKAGTFLRVHAEDDIEHLEQAFKMLGGMNHRQIDFVKENFLQSCFSFGIMLDAAAVPSTTEKNAASDR